MRMSDKKPETVNDDRKNTMELREGMSVEKLDVISRRCEDFVREHKAQGMVIQIVRHNNCVYHEAFGKLRHTPDSPDMPLDAIYPLASITKPITAACLMILLEEGRVDVGDRLDMYFPEFKGQYKNQVTLSTLLTHTSGFDEETMGDAYWEYTKSMHPGVPDEELEFDRDSYNAFMMSSPLSYKPNTNMSYANINYDLLAKVVEKVSGMGIDEFAQKRIFDPLGMKDSYFSVPESVYDRVMVREGRNGRPHWVNTEQSLKGFSGSNGVYSTTDDILKFMHVFMNKGMSRNGVRLLSPVTVQRMIEDRIPGISATFGDEVILQASWGYGWSVRGKRIDSEGMLHSDSACDHGGYGNLLVGFDPEYDLMFAAFKINHVSLRPYINNLIYAAIQE